MSRCGQAQVHGVTDEAEPSVEGRGTFVGRHRDGGETVLPTMREHRSDEGCSDTRVSLLGGDVDGLEVTACPSLHPCVRSARDRGKPRRADDGSTVHGYEGGVCRPYVISPLDKRCREILERLLDRPVLGRGLPAQQGDGANVVGGGDSILHRPKAAGASLQPRERHLPSASGG